MTKAKTALNKAKAGVKAFTFNGKPIKPVKFISMQRNFMSAQYENGDLVLDAAGTPVAWSKIKKEF